MKINILKNEELKEKIIKNFKELNTESKTKKPFFLLETPKNKYIIKGNENLSNEKTVGNYISLSRYASNKAIKENTKNRIGNVGLINIGSPYDPDFVLVESAVKNYKSLKEISKERGQELNGAELGGVKLFIKEIKNQTTIGNISKENYEEMISIIGFNLLMGNTDFRTENVGFECDDNGKLICPVIIDQEPKYAMGQHNKLYKNNKPCNLTIEDIQNSELVGLAYIFKTNPELWDNSVKMYQSYIENFEELYNLDNSVKYTIKKELSPKRISENINVSYDLDNLNEIKEGNKWIEDFLNQNNKKSKRKI